MADYVPTIDDAVIQRLIDRDYAVEAADLVRNLLHSYGSERHHLERDRVRAAILKLANAHLTDLQRHLAVAKIDFRDVIGAAEYPSQFRLGFTVLQSIGTDRMQEMRENDWRDYNQWLKKA